MVGLHSNLMTDTRASFPQWAGDDQAFTLQAILDHRTLLDYVDNFRIEHYLRSEGDDSRRKNLGQFFTPIQVATQMARNLGALPSSIRVLDPGAGAGILSAAVVSAIVSAKASRIEDIEIICFEVDSRISSFLRKTMDLCKRLCAKEGIRFTSTIHFTDYIAFACTRLYSADRFDLAILNPPYGKIPSGSDQWRLLKRRNLPRSNLYAAFMTLAALSLKRGGQLISITPRSFCNGPYFLPFRRALLSQLSIDHIHIYNSRSSVFGADNVLQENIILSATKCSKPLEVTVTSSENPVDKDLTTQTLASSEVIDKNDRNLVIRLASNGYERWVNQAVNQLGCTLADLNVSVSTGRVVVFRARKYLRDAGDEGSVPLVWPANAKSGYVHWPLPDLGKPAAIDKSGCEDKLLQPMDCYVLVKRFSAKEQKRRLCAAMLDPSQFDHDFVGIENHLNCLHENGSGLSIGRARGLTAWLNSTLADQYFRLFSGHTQVNAADLRAMKFPDEATLLRIGGRVGSAFPEQAKLDTIVKEELAMPEEGNEMDIQKKIDESLGILKAIGVPRAQQNTRSALTLLALVNIVPGGRWSDASAPLRRITEIMEYFSANYGVTYAPNTRETVRRQTIHQFWQMGLVVHNPDEPNRPINSPYYCYQISPDFLELVKSYNAPLWEENLANFLLAAGEKLKTLTSRERQLERIPVTLPDGSLAELSAGGQNELIKLIIEEFCPRFLKGGEVLYLGDAGDKLTDRQVTRFRELGLELDRHGKTPDIVVYLRDKAWLVLIEAVTSHGPIDRKRHNELAQLFANDDFGLVFVTAFETRQAMSRFLNDISWETEVWISDSPDHLIHFDGERFLGPYLT